MTASPAPDPLAGSRDLIDRAKALCQEAAEVRSQSAAIQEVCRRTRAESSRLRAMPNRPEPPADE